MTPEQQSLIQDTWAQVVPIADQAAGLFYDRLFEIDPKVRELFASADMATQGSRLISALNFVLTSINQIETTIPTLQALGRRHAGYGVVEKDYQTVGEAFLWTLATALKEQWTLETESAWAKAYGAVSDVMIAAAKDQTAPQNPPRAA